MRKYKPKSYMKYEPAKLEVAEKLVTSPEDFVAQILEDQGSFLFSVSSNIHGVMFNSWPNSCESREKAIKALDLIITDLFNSANGKLQLPNRKFEARHLKSVRELLDELKTRNRVSLAPAFEVKQKVK